MNSDSIIEEPNQIVTDAHEKFDYYDTLYKKDQARYDKLGAGYVVYKTGLHQGRLEVAGRILTMITTGKKLD